MMARKTLAFTLIELLIVVAIIGILAAIAVPNFLNAQVRAKIAKVEGDFKALATALEMYKLDTGRYISRYNNISWPWRFRPLTTPVAYVSQGYWPDPFAPQGYVTPDGDPINYCYESHGWPEAPVAYMNNKLDGSPHAWLHGRGTSYQWALISAGPDIDLNADAGAKGYPQDVFFLYSPSNGLKSAGDLIRFGP
ncbi:MAG TPA: prepilin-type N-terminal cleavage/methylation domain-containing protein [bacterium]|nr:prepilin-type N-terminal cleavage/methylation domain-containing protein [bacterium]HOL95727.1 prepilin-type N-terminal cleavage/methylation domain-containing protein [bacterium]HPP02366.1 prepilin-type N-terminal cleavage/methylation domain-containing protein [bacterium]